MDHKITFTLFHGNGPISKHFKRREYGFRTGKYERSARATSLQDIMEKI